MYLKSALHIWPAHMRISLHIVVALLLIALIYREILKGILPPVCGNNWQALRSATSAALLDSIHAALVLNGCVLILLLLRFFFFLDKFPHFSEILLEWLRIWIFLPVACAHAAFVYNQSFSSPLSVLPLSLVSLQDSEAAAENGNRDPGQSLPSWLK